MPNLSAYTNEELFKAAGIRPNRLSSISNEELFRAAGIQQRPRRDFIDIMTGGKELIPERNFIARGLYQTGKDIATIPAHFVNQFLLNVPRAALNRAGVDFPEAESGAGAIASKMAGVVGGFKNPLIRGAVQAPTLARRALSGAGAGALYTPTEDLSALGLRITQGIAGGTLPAVGPIIGKGLREIRKVPQYISKSSVDYIATKVVPKAYKIYQENVAKFTPSIQRFAEQKLKIPKSAIDTIRKSGIEVIQNTRKTFNDSVDEIYQRIQQGIAVKDAEVTKAYSQAFSKIGRKDLIPLNRTYVAAKGLLRRIGYIDELGNPTAIAQSQSRNPAFGNILDYFQSLKPTEGLAKNIPGGINKFQWILLRENLSKLQRTGQSQKKAITSILDALHDDAERAGVIGIKNARNLARANFSAEENILNSPLIKERKLSNFHNMTQQEKRTLQSIERYTGQNFTSDLEKITAGEYVDKLIQYSPDQFLKVLIEATDARKTNFLMNRYKDLLGPRAGEIFNDVVAHRRGVKLKYGGLSALGIATVGGGIKKGLDIFRGE